MTNLINFSNKSSCYIKIKKIYNNTCFFDFVLFSIDGLPKKVKLYSSRGDIHLNEEIPTLDSLFYPLNQTLYSLSFPSLLDVKEIFADINGVIFSSNQHNSLSNYSISNDAVVNNAFDEKAAIGMYLENIIYKDNNGITVKKDNNVVFEYANPDINSVAGCVYKDNYFLASQNGRVYEIDIDGSIVRSNIFSHVINSIDVYKGENSTILLCDNTGKIYCYDWITKSLLWSKSIGVNGANFFNNNLNLVIAHSGENVYIYNVLTDTIKSHDSINYFYKNESDDYLLRFGDIFTSWGEANNYGVEKIVLRETSGKELVIEDYQYSSSSSSSSTSSSSSSSSSSTSSSSSSSSGDEHPEELDAYLQNLALSGRTLSSESELNLSKFLKGLEVMGVDLTNDVYDMYFMRSPYNLGTNGTAFGVSHPQMMSFKGYTFTPVDTSGTYTGMIYSPDGQGICSQGVTSGRFDYSLSTPWSYNASTEYTCLFCYVSNDSQNKYFAYRASETISYGHNWASQNQNLFATRNIESPWVSAIFYVPGSASLTGNLVRQYSFKPNVSMVQRYNGVTGGLSLALGGSTNVLAPMITSGANIFSLIENSGNNRLSFFMVLKKAIDADLKPLYDSTIGSGL
jgi:hypothetical protein